MKVTGWLVVAAVVVAGTWQAVESRAALEIRTLSSRPDLVSGGDTLVAIKAPAGTPVDQLSVTLNGKDVTARFTLDAASGEFRGLVEGLRLGANRLMATTSEAAIRSQPHRHQLSDHRTDPVGSAPQAVRMQHGSLRPRTGARRQLLRAEKDLAPLSIDGQHLQAARRSGGPAPGGPRDHDDHRRQDRAVHRPRRLGRDQPRDLPARDPRRSGRAGTARSSCRSAAAPARSTSRA